MTDLELLRTAFRQSLTGTVEDHISDDQWERLACDELGAEERQHALDHMLDCPSCSDTYRAIHFLRREAAAFDAGVVQAFQEAFREVEPLLAYSVKANGNLSLLRRLRALGCGADITSLGELFRARKADIPPEDIVFAGVGKTEGEIVAALMEGIYGFNVRLVAYI